MIDNKNILELLKKELINNYLFRTLFIKAVESHNIKANDYYNILDSLNDAYSYINFTYIIYDVDAIIQKRLNDVINFDTIIKAIEILLIKE